MPMVQIDLNTETTTPQRRRAISDALHLAMQEVLQIPADDRFHTFYEHSSDTMFHEDVAFGIPRDEHLMFITFSFNNREAAQKDRLFAAVVRLLGEHADVTPEQLLLRVIETARENWWAAGRVIDPTTGYDERMTSHS